MGVPFVFFLGLFCGRSFLVVFFSRVFFFALIFDGITYLGLFFGRMFFLGLDFFSTSLFVLISVGVLVAGVVIVGKRVVITPDVLGLLVVLCNCGPALSSVSGGFIVGG